MGVLGKGICIICSLPYDQLYHFWVCIQTKRSQPTKHAHVSSIHCFIYDCTGEHSDIKDMGVGKDLCD